MGTVTKIDRTKVKKCIKCREWKDREKDFGTNATSSDGRQTICYSCKHTMNMKSRNRNVAARIRHHTGTRCLTQLGEHAPPNFIKDLELHLGYSIRKLVRHLSQDLKDREGSRRKLVEALNEGYHIDHIFPLSRFRVVVVDDTESPPVTTIDWREFQRCWEMTNLRAIPAEENLAKGAKVDSA